ncbi:MAG: hypothetical protein Q8P20_05620 [bacterium]|nr:hypothetical protein [bacterium]
MNNLKLIISIIILLGSCTEDGNNNITDVTTKEIGYVLEGTFSRTIYDSLKIYDCCVYDSLSGRLVKSGEHIIYSDDSIQPIGWLKYWDTTGKLTKQIDFIAFQGSRVSEINQVIKFGSDTLDTLFYESKFLRHKLTYLDEDTVEIYLNYRGRMENESNYAFICLTGNKDEFVFRSTKPEIKFRIPIKNFLADSNIQVLMIKTNEIEKEPDMINMEHIYYDIDLHK